MIFEVGSVLARLITLTLIDSYVNGIVLRVEGA